MNSNWGIKWIEKPETSTIRPLKQCRDSIPPLLLRKPKEEGRLGDIEKRPMSTNQSLDGHKGGTSTLWFARELYPSKKDFGPNESGGKTSLLCFPKKKKKKKTIRNQRNPLNFVSPFSWCTFCRTILPLRLPLLSPSIFLSFFLSFFLGFFVFQ